MGMPIQPQQLPNDINALKALVAEQAAQNHQLLAQKQAGDQENARLNAKVLTLQEQLNLALARRYAASGISSCSISAWRRLSVKPCCRAVSNTIIAPR